MLFPVSDDVPDLDSGPVLVAAWAAELTRTAAIPPALSAVELERLLTGVVTSLSLAGAAVPLDVERARGAGASLAYAGLVVPDVLPVTIAALGTHLAGVLWAAGAADPAAITPRIVAAVADGYVRTLRSRVHEVAAPHRSDAEVSPALRTSEARFQAVFTHAGTGIILGDPYGRILDVNASFAEMLGYSIEEVRGRDVRELIHPDEVPRMMDGFTAMIETGAEIRRFDRRYLHRDGHVVLTELTSSFVRDDHGEPIMVASGRGHHRAPRAAAAAAAPGAARPADRAAQPGACSSTGSAPSSPTPGSRVGLSATSTSTGSRRSTTRLGHDVGDQLLVAVAERLRRMRAPATVTWWPGWAATSSWSWSTDPATEELRPAGRAGPRGAGRAAPRRRAPAVRLGQHRRSSSSAVATTTPADPDARPPTYPVLGQGRRPRPAGRSSTPERNARDVTRYALLRRTLGRRVERGEFFVVYQPLVDLDRRQVLGVEALVRWRPPALGMLAPGPVHRPGRGDRPDRPAGPAGCWTRRAEQAARLERRRPGRGRCTSASTWRCGRSASPDLVGDVAAVLERTGLPAELLQLELTESALMGPDGRAGGRVSALAAMGVRIAIDDFGTGYSNLAYLRGCRCTR